MASTAGLRYGSKSRIIDRGKRRSVQRQNAIGNLHQFGETALRLCIPFMFAFAGGDSQKQTFSATGAAQLPSFPPLHKRESTTLSCLIFCAALFRKKQAAIQFPPTSGNQQPRHSRASGNPNPNSTSSFSRRRRGNPTFPRICPRVSGGESGNTTARIAFAVVG